MSGCILRAVDKPWMILTSLASVLQPFNISAIVTVPAYSAFSPLNSVRWLIPSEKEKELGSLHHQGLSSVVAYISKSTVQTSGPIFSTMQTYLGALRE